MNIVDAYANAYRDIKSHGLLRQHEIRGWLTAGSKAANGLMLVDASPDQAAFYLAMAYWHDSSLVRGAGDDECRGLFRYLVGDGFEKSTLAEAPLFGILLKSDIAESANMALALCPDALDMLDAAAIRGMWWNDISGEMRRDRADAGLLRNVRLDLIHSMLVARDDENDAKLKTGSMINVLLDTGALGIEPVSDTVFHASDGLECSLGELDRFDRLKLPACIADRCHSRIRYTERIRRELTGFAPVMKFYEGRHRDLLFDFIHPLASSTDNWRAGEAIKCLVICATDSLVAVNDTALASLQKHLAKSYENYSRQAGGDADFDDFDDWLEHCLKSTLDRIRENVERSIPGMTVRRGGRQDRKSQSRGILLEELVDGMILNGYAEAYDCLGSGLHLAVHFPDHSVVSVFAL